MATLSVLIDELKWARCDNCGKKHRGDKLKPMADIDERLEAGSVVPAGECPSCGALCYVCDGPRPRGSARPFTAKEIQKQIISYFRHSAEHWAKAVPRDPVSLSQGRQFTVAERCNGVAFDILVLLDGRIGAYPAFDIYPAPHPDDKQACIELGQTYYDPETKVNDVLLHEMYFKGRKRR